MVKHIHCQIEYDRVTEEEERYTVESIVGFKVPLEDQTILTPGDEYDEVDWVYTAKAQREEIHLMLDEFLNNVAGSEKGHFLVEECSH